MGFLFMLTLESWDVKRGVGFVFVDPLFCQYVHMFNKKYTFIVICPIGSYTNI